MNLDLHGSTKSLKKERRFKFQNEHLMAGYSLSLTPTSNSPIAYSQSYVLRRLKTWLGFLSWRILNEDVPSFLLRTLLLLGWFLCALVWNKGRARQSCRLCHEAPLIVQVEFRWTCLLIVLSQKVGVTLNHCYSYFLFFFLLICGSAFGKKEPDRMHGMLVHIPFWVVSIKAAAH